jgi:hypothetical protein
MADSALAMSAVRVAVHASRDGEMAALTRELAHVRGELSDITGRFARSDARYEAYIELCTNEMEVLRRELGRARRGLRDMEGRWVRSEVRYRSPYATNFNRVDPRYRLLTWREHAEEREAYIEERADELQTEADRLAHWAAQWFGGRDEDVPDVVVRAVRVMRGQTESEAAAETDHEISTGNDGPEA